ncbi:MAG: cyclic beta 1-2 glucan synthetase, partial [Thermomonas sp.]
MSTRSSVVRAWLRALRWMRGAYAGGATPLHGDSPLRSQLFSAEQMERHGDALARTHTLASARARDLLLVRLSDNQDVLERTCDMLGAASREGRRLTPADEWLLDNIYLIEEQVRIAQRHLPSGYSRELPRLAEGPSAGLPRVYDIALNAISHGDGRIDAESLSRFIAAYQSVAPLKLGELWAIPIMLRLALIENLRRVGVRVMSDRTDRNLADTWADEFTRVALSDPKGLVLVIADMMRSQPPMSRAFVAELTRRLQGQTAALAMPLAWLEQWLADSGNSSERMVQSENRQQAIEQVSISNSIGSLRFLETMDWREFVETMSVVDQVLRVDPDGTYGSMDFATRDHYRHVVERIARRNKISERDVAQATLELAQTASKSGQGAAHVGYYLIDEGRSILEAAVARGQFTDVLRRTVRRVPLLAYTAPIAIVVALFTTGLVVEARSELNERGLVWLVAALCVIAFSELGVALVNWAATLLASPRMLPRLDYSKGIPSHARTLVVVPTMFGDVAALRNLAEALEVRYLANRDANLKFALLTDFFDARQEVLDGDGALLDAAAAEIDALNARHASDGDDIFFMLHRPRQWNPREGVWMGHERKRGKLAALNQFLRDPAGAGQFLRISGNPDAIGHIRYVITLDTDTSLPRGTARDLVATLAHPLNWARFDPGLGRVTAGYTILQPRVGISMSGQRRTWYTRLYGSEPGIDPYTRAVSDVYQDLFNEGSFVGKGIYDVDAFEQSLDGRFPDNSILSHDLLEGCYARAGLVSDIQLYEGYPSRYAADVKRRYRWIRGDWQLLPGLLPSTPRADGTREPNPLSTLSQGKLLDNLRRSLVPAAMVGLLLMG